MRQYKPIALRQPDSKQRRVHGGRAPVSRYRSPFDLRRRDRLRFASGVARACMCCCPILTITGAKWSLVRALDRLNLSLTSYPQNAPLVVPPRLEARGDRQARLVARGDAKPCARSLPASVRHSELPLRCTGDAQRGHGGGVLPRHQRLDPRRMAQPRPAIAGVDRDPGPQHRTRGRGNRTPGRAIRASYRC